MCSSVFAYSDLVRRGFVRLPWPELLRHPIKQFLHADGTPEVRITLGGVCLLNAEKALQERREELGVVHARASWSFF